MTHKIAYLEDLSAKAWRTSSSRYNSSRRLKKRDWFAMLSIGLFSAGAICITVFQKVYEIPALTPTDNYLTLISIVFGLFIVVISLVEWGGEGGLKGEILYQNAQQLNQFQEEVTQRLAVVSNEEEITADDISELREKYEAIKQECPFNHELIDYRLLIAQQRHSANFVKLFKRTAPRWYEAAQTITLYYLSIYWYFGLCWLVIIYLICATPWPPASHAIEACH